MHSHLVAISNLASNNHHLLPQVMKKLVIKWQYQWATYQSTVDCECGLVLQWLGRWLDSPLKRRRFNSWSFHFQSTCAWLSPSSMNWYWPKGWWCTAAGKITAGLTASPGSRCQVYVTNITRRLSPIWGTVRRFIVLRLILRLANWCPKFEVCSFSCSRDISRV